MLLSPECVARPQACYCEPLTCTYCYQEEDGTATTHDDILYTPVTVILFFL